MDTLITQKEYMNGEYTHDQYYGQFVTRPLIEAVKRLIGEDKLKNSICPHFNDVNYIKGSRWIWDNLDARSYIDTKKWALSGMGVAANNTYVEEVTGRYGWSPSNNTCILKAAARVARQELAEPKQGREIKVTYRPLSDSSGSQCFETKANGTVDGIIDYYYADRGIFNIGKNGEDYLVKIVSIEFKN